MRLFEWIWTSGAMLLGRASIVAVLACAVLAVAGEVVRRRRRPRLQLVSPLRERQLAALDRSGADA